MHVWMCIYIPAFQPQHRWRTAWEWARLHRAGPKTQAVKCIVSNNRLRNINMTWTDEKQMSYLKRLDKGPQQVSYALRAIEQLNKTHDTEQSEESDGHTHVLCGLYSKEKRSPYSRGTCFTLVANVSIFMLKLKLTAIACIGSTSYKRNSFYNNTTFLHI